VAREHAALFDGAARVDLRASAYRDAQALEILRVDRIAMALPIHAHRGDEEDRLVALCEDLQWLLQADAALPPPQRRRCRYFERHVAPWVGAALDDLREACTTPFHRALAELARAFFELEREDCRRLARAAAEEEER
jgi:TorA maturation chaperone TorD